jgi:23S rRNA pseudouridine1911/1915/1917 synthase
MNRFVISPAEDGQTMAAVLRQHLSLPWSGARALCETGKVFTPERGPSPWLDPSKRVRAGLAVEVRPTARAPLPDRVVRAQQAILYEDSQVVVVNKPAGISSVPYERGETGTAMDLIRDAWRAEGRRATEAALHVVHRLDKDSSGLLLFAKTKGAERTLQGMWRQHDIERRYLCVAHGRVRAGRPGEAPRVIESYLVPDRGDGLRGSARQRPGHPPQGKRAISLVWAIEDLPACTVCEVQLETGKTHQIRIHFAEAGHPLVGERVYVRDYLRHGGEPIPSPRLLLHARTLGFVHPVSGEEISLRAEPPEDFIRQVERLRSAAGT